MENNQQNIGMKGNCADEEIVGTENKNLEMEKIDGTSSIKMNENALAEIGSPPKKIPLSPNVLDEVLGWIKRTELAQSKLSTSSFTFRQYCWPHLHGRKAKPRFIELLTFSHRRNDEGNKFSILSTKKRDNLITIADINPPEYIIGFGRISFEFIDDPALKFVQKILPLHKDVTILFDAIDGNTQQNGPVRHMMEMLAPKTSKLVICETHLNNLNKFNQQYPGFINGVQSICVHVLTETVVDLIVKWLMIAAPSGEDGKPKMLEIISEHPPSHAMEMDLFIHCVSEQFVNSTEPVNFIIRMEMELELIGYEDFKIENETTEEVLELKCMEEDEYFAYYIVRHKKNDGQTRQIDELEEQFEREGETSIWIDADM